MRTCDPLIHSRPSPLIHSPSLLSQPSPRGGHSATLVGSTLLLLGGCDGGEPDGPDDGFVERDLGDLTLLDLEARRYVVTERAAGLFEARSGHTAALVPYDGGVSLMVIGGRDYRPPELPWGDGQHHGRAAVNRLALDGPSFAEPHVAGGAHTSSPPASTAAG